MFVHEYTYILLILNIKLTKNYFTFKIKLMIYTFQIELINNNSVL